MAKIFPRYSRRVKDKEYVVWEYYSDKKLGYVYAKNLEEAKNEAQDKFGSGKYKVFIDKIGNPAPKKWMKCKAIRIVGDRLEVRK